MKGSIAMVQLQGKKNPLKKEIPNRSPADLLHTPTWVITHRHSAMNKNRKPSVKSDAIKRGRKWDERFSLKKKKKAADTRSFGIVHVKI